MRTIPFSVDGDPVTINVIEDTADFEECLRFIVRSPEYSLCFDTETTGLELFSPTFRIRLIQVGDERTAYVLQMHSRRDARATAIIDLLNDKGMTLHNAPYDRLACHVTGLMSLERTQDSTHDTRLLAHLIDPRGKEDGGTGFSLKDLSKRYVDAGAKDTQNGLKTVFKETNTDWDTIDINNETYLLYAGLDVIYGARLHTRLRNMVNREGYARLAKFEHDVQKVTTRMKLRGFRVDVPYSERLIEILERRYDTNFEIAQSIGVENLNSSAQVSNLLIGMGWKPRQFTDGGKPKLDKEIMTALIQDPKTPGEAKRLLESVKLAKRARKWRAAYAEGMLNARDFNNHVHPDINSLQARTSRMSIGNPPLQQLPSRGDDAWVIRRQVIADEGWVIGSADYDQVEFRVLAALADISKMKYAIANGIDLHDYTAELVYGPDFSKHERGIGKGVGFGKVFGGGAVTLSRQTGAPIDQVREAIRAYDEAYFELPAFAKALQREQRQRGGYILNYHGRYLPLDNGREYAAVNYSVQSIARDLLAQALLDLDAAGLDEYLLLPVHDEVLFQAPREDAVDIAREVGKVMSGQFIDVPITASGEVYGKTWAEGYVYKDSDGVVRSKGTKNELKDWVEVA